MTMSGSILDVATVDKEENYSDAICAICDNGGELICCEGKCLRSFHATVEDGIDSACDSLELSDKIIKEGTFTCKNCQHNQHQCYVCGKLGSSDKSAGAEVFQCGSCTCGYFYHPTCVEKALQFVYEDDTKDVGAEIASGKPFICPLHFCYACKHKEQENETSVMLQFAVCRRCPIAYHRECLPGTIAFEDDDDEGIIARAWDDLIPNKILIYCLEHVIDEDIQTPVRDHLKFPNNMEKKKQVKRTLSKPSERVKPEKLQEERQLEKLPKRRFASKTALQKSSSSASYRNCSGLYSFRDRKLVTKYRMAPLLAGLKKKVRKLANNSSSGKNMDNSGSEKRRQNSTEVEGSGISGFEESSNSEKKRKIGQTIAAACENDSLATLLENQHRKQSKIIKEGSSSNKHNVVKPHALVSFNVFFYLHNQTLFLYNLQSLCSR